MIWPYKLTALIAPPAGTPMSNALKYPLGLGLYTADALPNATELTHYNNTTIPNPEAECADECCE